MTCKICHTNEIDSTSGVCWECMGKWDMIYLYTPQIDGKWILVKEYELKNYYEDNTFKIFDR